MYAKSAPTKTIGSALSVGSSCAALLCLGVVTGQVVVRGLLHRRQVVALLPDIGAGALGATLIKNHAHWRSFETVFEVYFSLRGPEYRIAEGDGDSDFDELWREMQEQQKVMLSKVKSALAALSEKELAAVIEAIELEEEGRDNDVSIFCCCNKYVPCLNTLW